MSEGSAKRSRPEEETDMFTADPPAKIAKTDNGGDVTAEAETETEQGADAALKEGKEETGTTDVAAKGVGAVEAESTKTPATDGMKDSGTDGGVEGAAAQEAEPTVPPASEETKDSGQADGKSEGVAAREAASEPPASEDTKDSGPADASAENISAPEAGSAVAPAPVQETVTEAPSQSAAETTAAHAPAVAAVASEPAAATAAPVVTGLPPGVSGDLVPAVDPTVPATVTNPNSIVEERGEVSALYVGRVIGKGGEMIRDLQARSGCRIDVDQNVPPGNPRIITYRGTRKTVDFAKQLVATLCSENGKDTDLPLGEASRKQLIVPSSSIGKIIGRGGEMIRDLQSRSQAKIQVDHSGNPGIDPNSRQVTVTGTEQAVVKAEEMIMFLVANPMMDAMAAINMLVEDKTQRGGVWGSGPPYHNLPNGGQGMQGQTGYGGYQEQQGGYGGGGGYPQQAGGYGQYGAAVGGGGVEMEYFPAAKQFMGRIIGQKGVTINDLQRRSGCDIQINQDVPQGYECQISIKGSRQGIESAKQMLREIIEMGPNHPYAGGAQQGGYGGPQGGYQQGGYAQPQAQQYQYQQPVTQQPIAQQPYGQQPYGQPYQAPYGQQAQPYQQQQGQPYGMVQQQYGGYGQQQPSAMPVPAASLWKSATAADGQVYYYNEKTGETQWEKPPGML